MHRPRVRLLPLGTAFLLAVTCSRREFNGELGTAARFTLFLTTGSHHLRLVFFSRSLLFLLMLKLSALWMRKAGPGMKQRCVPSFGTTSHARFFGSLSTSMVRILFDGHSQDSENTRCDQPTTWLGLHSSWSLIVTKEWV